MAIRRLVGGGRLAHQARDAPREDGTGGGDEARRGREAGAGARSRARRRRTAHSHTRRKVHPGAHREDHPQTCAIPRAVSAGNY